MAITLNPSTRVFSIPQADLTLVTGTLYAADTDVLRKAMMTILASEDYIWMPDSYAHATEVTVAGTTFARTLITLNNFSYTFTPDTQWTVRLENSNNDFFDVENGILNQNQVQVIPTNAAGLIVTNNVSGLTTEQDEALNLIKYAVAGNSEVSSDNLIVTIKDDVGNVERVLNISSDGRVRTL